MKVAVVLHGPAGKDTLRNEAYKAKFGVSNPNLPLIDELSAAGVDMYLCGQTAARSQLPKSDIAPAVKLALSAMTVMATLPQQQGYTIMP